VCLTNDSNSGVTTGQIKPDKGYWQKLATENNPEFLPCLNDACTTEGCDVGYSGNLCAQCKPGYGRAGNYDCKKCQDPALTKLYLALGCIGFFVGIALIAKLTMDAHTNSYHSVYFKIFLSGMQLNSIAARFDFQWPEEVQSFLDLQDNVASIGSSFLSIDCFLSRRDVNNGTQSFYAAWDEGPESESPFYIKSVVFFIIPFSILLVACVAFGPYVLIQYWRKKLSQRDLAKWREEILSGIVISVLDSP